MAEAALIGFSALGLGFNVVGKMREAESNAQALEFNATSAEGAADEADKNAVLAVQQAEEKVRRYKYEAAKILGGIRAQYGASGVTLDGSPQDFIEDSTAVAKANELALKYEGVLQSQKYRQDAASYRTQAEEYRRRAGSFRSAGVIGAIGSAINTAGNVFQRTSNFASTRGDNYSSSGPHGGIDFKRAR